MTGPWTSLPAARALLASCAERPPATRVAHARDLTDRYEKVYVADERVRELRKIYRAESQRLLRLGDEIGDYRAFALHCLTTVDRAIEDAGRDPGFVAPIVDPLEVGRSGAARRQAGPASPRASKRCLGHSGTILNAGAGR